MGTDLGRNIANPQGGQALYQGGTGAAQAMSQANAYNPFATALTGFSRSPSLTNAASKMFGGGGGTNPFTPENVYAFGTQSWE
jgi:hypothetical protein